MFEQLIADSDYKKDLKERIDKGEITCDKCGKVISSVFDFSYLVLVAPRGEKITELRDVNFCDDCSHFFKELLTLITPDKNVKAKESMIKRLGDHRSDKGKKGNEQ